MARPPIDEHWVVRVGEWAEGGLKPPSIARMLKQEALETGRAGCPKERTIRRIYEVYMALDPRIRLEQARFKWPQHIRQGLLPWEASRTVLDFIYFCTETLKSDRPTFRQCKWYWRVKLAAPTMPIGQASVLAKNLAAVEYIRDAKLGEAILDDRTYFLAYQPWLGETERGIYLEAAERIGFETSVGVKTSGRDALRAVLGEHYGTGEAEAIINVIGREQD